jgi:hypothetical protein
MATVYRCDGCDREFKEKRGNITEITIQRDILNGDEYAIGNQDTKLDLCTRCQMSFERFVKSLREDRVEAGTGITT